MKNLDALAIFVQAAESRSFTKAAVRLGISASGVSKAISRLEDELHVKLLNRTTRTVSLTEEGSIFFGRCRDILADIDNAELAISKSQVTPGGRLRVQMPVGFGREVVVPALPNFLAKNPDMIVDLELSDRMVDLVHDGFDASVRLGPQPPSSIIRRKLFDTRIVSVASPAYLERRGEPRFPDDLDAHDCIGHLELRTGRYRTLELQKDGQTTVKYLSGRLNINDSQSLLQAALAGLGIARLATFVVADAVRAGRLRVVLKDYTCFGPEVAIFYVPSRQLYPRLQTFTQFLVDLLPPNPPWDDILA